MAAERQRTVVKLGGSIFDSACWPDRLQTWFARQPQGDYFAIVGGGKLIDALRDIDQLYQLSQSDMHWRCIRALDATFEIAGELIPVFERITTHEQLCQILDAESLPTKKRFHWVRISSFYTPENENQACNKPALEHGWNTTSDSLALLLASRIRANRCVLLKSCEVEPSTTLRQAIAAGIVDSQTIHFESLVPTIEFDRI